MTSVMPCRFRRFRMCSMTGLPTIGTIGLGRLMVRGRRRDPSPPAITTAFMTSLSLARGCSSGHRNCNGAAGGCAVVYCLPHCYCTSRQKAGTRIFFPCLACALEIIAQVSVLDLPVHETRIACLLAGKPFLIRLTQLDQTIGLLDCESLVQE